MRKQTMLISLLLGLMLASVPVTAQRPPTSEAPDAPDVDIQAIAESTLSADLDTMIAGLQEPIADADLPESFFSAEYVAPSDVSDDDLILPMDALTFAEGSVGLTVGYNPQGEGFSIGMASLNYVLLDREVTERDLDDLRMGFDGDEDLEVDDIEVDGVAAVFIGGDIEESGIYTVVSMIVMPVGNTLVLGVAAAASTDQPIDRATTRADAENLVIAGVTHLGAAADDAQ